MQAWEARVSATIEKIEKPSIKSAITKPEDSKKCKKSLPKTVKSSTRRYVSKPKSGYTLGEADILRRAMSKKKTEVMLEERDKFIVNSINRGYDKEVATRVYDLILKLKFLDLSSLFKIPHKFSAVIFVN